MENPIEIEHMHQFVIKLVGALNQPSNGPLQGFRRKFKVAVVNLHDFSDSIYQQTGVAVIRVQYDVYRSLSN
jgi:hypothetical protein